jgi:hypothetical protein
MALVAYERDSAGEAGRTQSAGCASAGVAGANDDDVLKHPA